MLSVIDHKQLRCRDVYGRGGSAAVSPERKCQFVFVTDKFTRFPASPGKILGKAEVAAKNEELRAGRSGTRTSIAKQRKRFPSVQCLFSRLPEPFSHAFPRNQVRVPSPASVPSPPSLPAAPAARAPGASPRSDVDASFRVNTSEGK